MSDVDVNEQFSKKNAEFAFDLYSKVIKETNVDNIIISPLSIQILSVIALAGASDNTAKEIVQALQFSSEDVSELAESFKDILVSCESSTSLYVASKIYISNRYDIRPEFAEVVTTKFFSEVDNIDFLESVECTTLINLWAEERSQGKIKDMLNAEDMDEVTSAILVNAVYFRPQWEFPFRTNDSYPSDFWINEGESIEVIFMTTIAKLKYRMFRDDFVDLSVEVIQLPFRNSNLSLLILLPELLGQLEQLESKLFEMDVSKLVTDMNYQEVAVHIPRFEMEYSPELKEIFKLMGMKKMFTADADFPQMLLDEDDPVYIQKVEHKVLMEVYEEETELNNGPNDKETCSSPQGTFTANRPFIFMVLDDDNNIFVLGRFSRPNIDQE